MKQGLSAPQLFMMGFGAIVGVGWIVVVGEWVAQAGAPGGSVIALAACTKSFKK